MQWTSPLPRASRGILTSSSMRWFRAVLEDRRASLIAMMRASGSTTGRTTPGSWCSAGVPTGSGCARRVQRTTRTLKSTCQTRNPHVLSLCNARATNVQCTCRTRVKLCRATGPDRTGPDQTNQTGPGTLPRGRARGNRPPLPRRREKHHRKSATSCSRQSPSAGEGGRTVSSSSRNLNVASSTRRSQNSVRSARLRTRSASSGRRSRPGTTTRRRRRWSSTGRFETARHPSNATARRFKP